MEALDATLSDLTLTFGVEAVDSTQLESNGINLKLTLGVEAVDSTLLERNGLGLDDWDGTKGTVQAEREGETSLGQGTVDASQGSFLHIHVTN